MPSTGMGSGTHYSASVSGGSNVHNPYAIPHGRNGEGVGGQGTTNGAVVNSSTAEAQATTVADSEEDRIKRMFEQSDSYWKQTERKMEHARFIPYAGGARSFAKPAVVGGSADSAGKGELRSSGQGSQGDSAGGNALPAFQQSFQPDYTPRPPPQGYVCYRCGERGHWIQQCPKANDPDYENKPKLKRTTGIPRSFLKVVEGSEAKNQKLLLTGTGELVMQVMNNDEWAKNAERTRKLAVDAVVRTASDTPNVPGELVCGICHNLLRDAVKLPCCEATFCEDCLKFWLIDNPNPKLRLCCPGCGTPNQTPDRAVANESKRARVQEFLSQRQPSKPESPAPAATPPPTVPIAVTCKVSPVQPTHARRRLVQSNVKAGGPAPRPAAGVSKSKKLAFLTVRSKR